MVKIRSISYAIISSGYYLSEGGYTIVIVCLSVSNFVQNFQTDLHEIFREGWQWASEQLSKF